MGRVYNFSAGPAVLPEEVLQDFTQQQQADFIQLPSHSRQHLHMHIQVSRSHASLRARLSL